MQHDEHIEPGAVSNAEPSPIETGISVETEQQIIALEQRVLEADQAQQKESTEVREVREIAAHQAELAQYKERSDSEVSESASAAGAVPELTPALVPTLEQNEAEAAAKKLVEKAESSTKGAREVLALLRRIGPVSGGPFIVEQVHDHYLSDKKEQSDGNPSG